MMTLPEYLKSRAETQGQFAARVGTTQANVSKLCGKHPKISADMAVKVERATDGAVPVEAWPQFRVLSDRHIANPSRSGDIPCRNAPRPVQPPMIERTSGRASA